MFFWRQVGTQKTLSIISKEEKLNPIYNSSKKNVNSVFEMIIDTQVWADAQPPAWKNISEGKGRFVIITIIIYPRLFSNIQQKCLLLTDDSNSYHLSLLRWKPCVQAHRLLCDWDVWRRLPPCPQHKVIPREHVKGLSLCFKLTSILYSVFMSFSTWH